MEGLHLKRLAYTICCMVLGLVLMAGCCPRPYTPVKEFPANKVADAGITYNFNAKGESFIADREGKPVASKKFSFAEIIKASCDQKSSKKDEQCWYKIIGNFTLYRDKAQEKVWLCNDDAKCVEGKINKNDDRAVFSLNFNGKNLFNGKEVFFADAEGKGLNTLSDLETLFHKDDSIRMQATQGDSRQMQATEEKKHRTFGSFFGKKPRVEVFNTFTIYKMKGSERILDYSSGECRCKCIDYSTWAVTDCNAHGQCN